MTTTVHDHPAPELSSGRNALAALQSLRHETGSAITYEALATGFQPLDDVLDGGIRPGELLVLGGKPGVGKTVLALQWARTMAIAGHTAIVVCYEHDERTLLSRLLACELGEALARAGSVQAEEVAHLQAMIRNFTVRGHGWELGADRHPVLAEVEEHLAGYAERLVLVPASGSATGLTELRRLVDDHRGETAALVIDYVQKVPDPNGHDEVSRLVSVVEGIKELALADDVAVIGVSGADVAGLGARRVGLRHLRGAENLAYEADVALLLNEKLAVVSKAHLAYDITRIDEFSRRVICTVEKNRRGLAGVDLEFTKDFENYRFEPTGRWVAERLWDEGSLET